MSNYIKVASLGPQAYYIDPKIGNTNAIDKMIYHWKEELEKVLHDKPDIIVLPEACDRPQNFSKEQKIPYYKERKDKILDFFRDIANKNKCYIAYSAAREINDGSWRNSTQIIDRQGNIAGIYNKNHVVIEENTEDGILYGRDTPIINCDFGKLACVICFDLNFDELRLKYKALKPDIILFSSLYHGGMMQSYWAYSCRSHFIGAVAGLPCSVISPIGETISNSTNYFNYTITDINLDCKVIHLDHNWDKLKNIKIKYGSKVEIKDPGYLGAVLISSKTDEFNINDIIKEFNIEILDAYMEKSLTHKINNTEV
ncbi:MAG: carbon-nitrogen hydrolase family protein [Clostridia bacterium]|nr:carbon-nitrogen hydrolase family protein [Clostridia bacterium]